MLQAKASPISHSVSALLYLVFTVSINLFFHAVKVSERSNVHSPLQLILLLFLLCLWRFDPISGHGLPDAGVSRQLSL
jgi:hypothetical protein